MREPERGRHGPLSVSVCQGQYDAVHGNAEEMSGERQSCDLSLHSTQEHSPAICRPPSSGNRHRQFHSRHMTGHWIHAILT